MAKNTRWNNAKLSQKELAQIMIDILELWLINELANNIYYLFYIRC